ncbi:MAG TPA: ParB/RepB/Spo0J family partition protein [Candidatus Acidoferrales bacterium]|nr:ParB/RepB/Spo0J family partition protein [Candidatus Acidoferrales bacterium]
MSAPKRALGRGLGALLGDAAVPVSPAAPEHGWHEIPVDRITPNPFQPRKHFDDTTLAELQASIAEYGVLMPVIVRRRGQGYELIAGERRWRASAALKRPTIPAIVRDTGDRESLEVAIVENLQRENLNALEEAAGFAFLIEEYGFTQDEVARRLGKSRPAVANALRLLGLPDAIKAMIVSGTLGARHARAILAAPENQRLALAQRAAGEGLTAVAVERIAGQLATPKPRAAAAEARALSADEHDFETRLRERFGTRVALIRSGRGGRLEFRFGDDDELMRLGDLLLGEPP